jgi:hypothetical protein
MKRGIGNAGVLRVLLGGVAMLLLSLTAALADVPFPEIPKAKGGECVEPPELMRSHHMDFILHQRDETVHQGIRTKKYALTECIDCHVTPGPDGKYPRVTSKQHFCSACHQYAAVRIDCFECHNDHPQGAQQPKPGASGLWSRHGERLTMQGGAGRGPAPGGAR